MPAIRTYSSMNESQRICDTRFFFWNIAYLFTLFAVILCNHSHQTPLCKCVTNNICRAREFIPTIWDSRKICTTNHTKKHHCAVSMNSFPLQIPFSTTLSEQWLLNNFVFFCSMLQSFLIEFPFYREHIVFK